MASAFTHAFVAVAAGKIYARDPMPRRFWATSIALSILPDLDVIGFAFGIRYEDFLGHRGFSHSIVFAMIASKREDITAMPVNEIPALMLALIPHHVRFGLGWDRMTRSLSQVCLLKPWMAPR